MQLSVGMKVGLVSLFSCLALLLGLLSSISMVSAQTANTLQTTHISVIALADPKKPGNSQQEGSANASPSCVTSITYSKGDPPEYACK